jgi:hypothetical protein
MRNSLNLLVILAALPLLALPIAAQAQFQYAIADGQVTITNYIGSGDVTIADSINGDPVTAIGAYAFWGSSLTSVTIPDSVTNIGDGAFNDCLALESITVNASNTSYASAGGVLFDQTLSTLIQYPAKRAGSYAIPDSVTTIGDLAFFGCNALTSVTIPDSVTTIGQEAFWDSVFLTSVMIGNGVTNIVDGAFLYCSDLESITVNASNTSYASAGGVLFDKTLATLIQYPPKRAGSYAIPDSVTTIGDLAFADCGLTSVTIPNSVTSIGASAFLETGLTSVTIPDSVTTLGDSAFQACKLTSVTIGNSVTSIGEEAFAQCASLRQVYFQGSAPSVDGVVGSEDTSVFLLDATGKVYYVPGTTGWGATFGGWPTAQSYQPQPQILGGAAGLTAGNAGLQFTISWATNTSVVVEASTDLQSWTPVSTNTLVNGVSAFVDSSWTNYPQRFYRVLSQ